MRQLQSFWQWFTIGSVTPATVIRNCEHDAALVKSRQFIAELVMIECRRISTVTRAAYPLVRRIHVDKIILIANF